MAVTIGKIIIIIIKTAIIMMMMIIIIITTITILASYLHDFRTPSGNSVLHPVKATQSICF